MAATVALCGLICSSPFDVIGREMNWLRRSKQGCKECDAKKYCVIIIPLSCNKTSFHKPLQAQFLEDQIQSIYMGMPLPTYEAGDATETTGACLTKVVVHKPFA